MDVDIKRVDIKSLLCNKVNLFIDVACGDKKKQNQIEIDKLVKDIKTVILDQSIKLRHDNLNTLTKVLIVKVVN